MASKPISDSFATLNISDPALRPPPSDPEPSESSEDAAPHILELPDALLRRILGQCLNVHDKCVATSVCKEFRRLLHTDPDRGSWGGLRLALTTTYAGDEGVSLGDAGPDALTDIVLALDTDAGFAARVFRYLLCPPRSRGLSYIHVDLNNSDGPGFVPYTDTSDEPQPIGIAYTFLTLILSALFQARLLSNPPAPATGGALNNTNHVVKPPNIGSTAYSPELRISVSRFEQVEAFSALLSVLQTFPDLPFSFSYLSLHDLPSSDLTAKLLALSRVKNCTRIKLLEVPRTIQFASWSLVTALPHVTTLRVGPHWDPSDEDWPSHDDDDDGEGLPDASAGLLAAPSPQCSIKALEWVPKIREGAVRAAPDVFASLASLERLTLSRVDRDAWGELAGGALAHLTRLTALEVHVVEASDELDESAYFGSIQLSPTLTSLSFHLHIADSRESVLMDSWVGLGALKRLRLYLYRLGVGVEEYAHTTVTLGPSLSALASLTDLGIKFRSFEGPPVRLAFSKSLSSCSCLTRVYVTGIQHAAVAAFPPHWKMEGLRTGLRHALEYDERGWETNSDGGKERDSDLSGSASDSGSGSESLAFSD